MCCDACPHDEVSEAQRLNSDCFSPSTKAMSRPSPGFQYPKPTGKYDHPWIKQVPPGRARVYDIMYKSVTTFLVVAAAYTFYETSKGTYYILAASRKRANEAAAARSESQ